MEHKSYTRKHIYTQNAYSSAVELSCYHGSQSQKQADNQTHQAREPDVLASSQESRSSRSSGTAALAVPRNIVHIRGDFEDRAVGSAVVVVIDQQEVGRPVPVPC